MKIGSIIKDALMLFIITLVLVLVLSAAKVVTQTSIDKANLEAQRKAFNEVCPGFSTSEDITSDVIGAATTSPFSGRRACSMPICPTSK